MIFRCTDVRTSAERIFQRIFQVVQVEELKYSFKSLIFWGTHVGTSAERIFQVEKLRYPLTFYFSFLRLSIPLNQNFHFENWKWKTLKVKFSNDIVSNILMVIYIIKIQIWDKNVIFRCTDVRTSAERIFKHIKITYFK